MNGVPPVRAVVTIDGLDGSGKSHLAARLQEVLGAGTLVLAVDDFRRPVDWSRHPDAELSLYYYQRYDLSALDDCLRAFREGAAGWRYRGFDGAREALGDEREVSFAGIDVVIVEGVFVARLLGAVDALSIYVDIPRDEARRRIHARDAAKGRSPDEIGRRIDRRYFPAHDRYLDEQQARDRALVVLENREPQQPRLLRARLPMGPGWARVRDALERLLEPADRAHPV